MDTNDNKNIITLSNGEKVTLIEKITWGIKEKLRTTVLSGVSVGSKGTEVDGFSFNGGAVTEARYAAIELSIVKIETPDGTERAYSRDWMDNLSVEDGDAVYSAVERITALQKKD